MANVKNATLSFRWVRDAADAKRLAAFFAANITPSYVSHSELQGPRALAPGVWAPDIGGVLERELVERIATPLDPAPGETTLLAAALTVDGTDVGVFLVTFARTAATAFGILEDIVIDARQRSKGLGAAYLSWIQSECRARGIQRLFLESGHDNHHAHEFFEREGFKSVSVVMMKQLD